MADPPTLFRIVEIDRMTGAEEMLINYGQRPPHGGDYRLWTREEADDSVAWREKNITNRYGYRIEEVTRG